MIPSAEAARAYTSPVAGSVLVALRPGTLGLEISPPQETCTSAPARVTPTTARLGRTSLQMQTFTRPGVDKVKPKGWLKHFLQTH